MGKKIEDTILESLQYERGALNAAITDAEKLARQGNIDALLEALFIRQKGIKRSKAVGLKATFVDAEGLYKDLNEEAISRIKRILR